MLADAKSLGNEVGFGVINQESCDKRNGTFPVELMVVETVVELELKVVVN
jgi:hypothetical protein